MTEPLTCVLTGGPCCGKTSLIRELAARGYTTGVEGARLYYDRMKSQGHDPETIRWETDYQPDIISDTIRAERAVDKQHRMGPAFLDRSLIDCLAYMRDHDATRYPYGPWETGVGPVPKPVHWPPSMPFEPTELELRYDKVFVPDLLPFEDDGVRTEDAEAAREMHELLIDEYKRFGYDPIRVPVNDLDSRASYIEARS